MPVPTGLTHPVVIRTECRFTASNPMAAIRQVLPGVPAAKWEACGNYKDIVLDRCHQEGIARIAINRPEKRNAFRPQTVSELCDAFTRIREDRDIGVVLFTGVGPAADGVHAFCAGGDQSVRGDGGYVGEDGLSRLNVLDLLEKGLIGKVLMSVKCLAEVLDLVLK